MITLGLSKGDTENFASFMKRLVCNVIVITTYTVAGDNLQHTILYNIVITTDCYSLMFE